MRKTVLVLASVLLFAIAATPAFAATVVEESVEPFAGGIPSPVCGGVWLAWEGERHNTVWDNGHSIFEVKGTYTITDASGDVIGKGFFREIWVRGVGASPLVRQFNQTMTCPGTGKVSNRHFGVTFDEQGRPHAH